MKSGLSEDNGCHDHPGAGIGCTHGCGEAPICNGTRVVLHGLTASARNGSVGRVAGWDAARGRYLINLDEGPDISVRPGNLMRRSRVEIVGFDKAPRLNGEWGELEDFDAERDQYQVSLEESGLTLGLKPECCILAQGTPVQLRGLSQKELNGLLGRIVDVDRGSARYTVECENGRQVKVRFSRVLCQSVSMEQ